MGDVRDDISGFLPDLRRFAFSLVGAGRNAEADDLVQACVLRALEKAAQFEPGTNLKAWLFTQMRSIFISAGRRAQIRRRHAEAVARGPALVAPPRQIDFVMLRETVRAMRRLSQDEIDTVRDLAIAKRPYELIAARDKLPVGTLKSRLHRTRGKLRQMLDMDTTGIG